MVRQSWGRPRLPGTVAPPRPQRTVFCNGKCVARAEGHTAYSDSGAIGPRWTPPAPGERRHGNHHGSTAGTP
eukprot:scaffold262684_cov32-Tisochrysis_lutea.AAC.2